MAAVRQPISIPFAQDSDMFPCPPLNYEADGYSANTIFFSQTRFLSSFSREFLSYLMNCLLIKDGPAMRSPLGGPLSILRDHVCHVVDACSNKKMVWINALWIIALVANAHARGYSSIKKLIRKSMRSNGLIPNMKSSIFPNHGSRPKPAGFCFIYMIKKIFGGRGHVELLWRQ